MGNVFEYAAIFQLAESSPFVDAHLPTLPIATI